MTKRSTKYKLTEKTYNEVQNQEIVKKYNSSKKYNVETSKFLIHSAQFHLRTLIHTR